MAPTPVLQYPPSPVTRPKGKSQISSSIIIAIVAPITFAAMLFLAGYCFLTKRARKKYYTLQEEFAGNDILTAETLQFDFGTIQAATNRFLIGNKLGAGGFGEVYKPVEEEILILIVMLVTEVLVKVAMALVNSLQSRCRNEQSRT
ncbi:hypothetical protein Q3G72_018960 [Acer saccharum]|nr:hypothetical protein Q3G72_018960 [Acer saccharum]